MFTPKFSVGIWCMGGVADRFLPQGYEAPLDFQGRLERVRRVREVTAIELFDDEFLRVPPDVMRKMLDDAGIQVSCLNVNTHSFPKWQRGALTNRDSKLRQEAIDATKKAIDQAAILGCSTIGLWLGVDGFDYPFQVAYDKGWELLLEALAEIADYAPQMRISLEYKLKEPRQYLFVGNAFRAAYIVKLLNRKNVGVTVDFGHALMAKENPGEVAAFLMREGLLFNVHFNDAYREWDDDLIAGSINVYETLEFLFYLDKGGYSGYLGFDIFPYRMAPEKALELCVRNTLDLCRALERVDKEALSVAQESMDAAFVHEVVRRAFF